VDASSGADGAGAYSGSGEATADTGSGGGGAEDAGTPGNANSADGGGGGTEDAGGTPTISIISPTAGATVAVSQPPESPAEIVTIEFTVTNFTVMPPGTCPGGAANVACGHVQLYVDGSACTPQGELYNSAGTVASSSAGAATGNVFAFLNSCPTVNGPHTVSLELHKDDNSPLDGPSGTVISAQVTFIASSG
jgi:hypothetical protein